MKKLIFVRHSKAEDPNPEISDFERSLTNKGKSLSHAMALRLREKEKHAGVILTSPAFRAVETALIFAGVFRIPSDEILQADNIYNNFNLETLLHNLTRVKEDEELVTLFGHNPSFTELASTLSTNGCDFMQKCAIVGISFKISTWSEISRNTGNIEYYLKP